MPGWPRAAPTATGARVDDVRRREEMLPVMIGIMPSPRPVTGKRCAPERVYHM
jgi:hypothetical protein